MAETLAGTSQDTSQNTSQNTQGQPKSETSATQIPGGAVSPTAEDETKKSAAEASTDESAPAEPPVTYTATAYSLRGRTASGKPVKRGLIAADRRVLPIGTRVKLHAGSYSGEYVVADTGSAVRGRKIDIWMPSTGEAMRFGRRPVKLTVLSRVRPRTVKQKSR